MYIEYNDYFRKRYKALSSKMQDRVDARISLFASDPFAVILNNHKLHGEFKIYRSINITGDLRALYEIREDGVRFVELDTHSNLY